MGTGKQYDEEFKKQAIKLAKEIGTKEAADELLSLIHISEPTRPY